MRGLMKSCAPISGLERPSLASRAMWASWGVSTLARVVGALARGLARGQELVPGALGKPLGADTAEHLVGGSELLARVDAAVLAAQPFAV